MLNSGAVRIADVERVALQHNFCVSSEAIDLNPQMLRINKLVLPGSPVLFPLDVGAVLPKLNYLSTGLIIMNAVWEVDGRFLQLPFAIQGRIGLRRAAPCAQYHAAGEKRRNKEDIPGD